MLYGLVQNGQVLDTQDVQVLTERYTSSGGKWLPFVGEPPYYNPISCTCVGPLYTIHPDYIECSWIMQCLGTKMVKNNAVQYLRSIRQKYEEKGTMWNGHLVDTTPDVQAKLTSASVAAQASLAMQQPFELDYKFADNSFAALSATEVMSLFQTVLTYVKNCYSNEETLGQRIQACTSVPQLEAIDYSAGWPT